MLGGLIVALAGAGLLTQVAAAGGPGLVVAGAGVMSLGLAPLFTLAADLASAPRRPSGRAPPPGCPRRARSWAARSGSRSSARSGRRCTGARWGSDALAHETLGGAVEAAGRLPVAMRAEFLEPARAAFTQGLQVAATVSGAIIAAAALLVVTLLRRGEDRAPAAAGACA